MIVDFRPKYIPITLTLRERQVLVDDSIAIPADVLRLIEKGTVHGKSVTVSLTLDDLEQLVEGIAFEANHAETRKQERFFDGLYGRLNPIFEKHVAAEKREKEGDTGCEEETPAQVIEQLLQEGKLGSPAEVLRRIAENIKKHNTASAPDMGGLSPQQVFQLNQSGWWAEPYPIHIETSLSLDQMRPATLLHNARALLRTAIDVGGAPLTTSGNLKRAFVAQMFDLLDMANAERDSIRRVCKVINEIDVFPLHVARIVCHSAGLLTPRKGRLVAGRAAKGLLGDDKAGALYGKLFDALFRKIDLAYFDRIDVEARGVQITLPYVLYRFRRLDIDKEHAVLPLSADVFLPAVREELGPSTEYVDRPSWVLTARVLRPLSWLGLVDVITQIGDQPPSLREGCVRRLPLFDAFLRFNI